MTNFLDPLSDVTHQIPTIPTAGSGRVQPELPTRKLLTPTPGGHPDDYDLAIDNSTLEKFTICPRKSENYSVYSREADRDQSAQQFGRLFHLCEELRLRHGLSDAVVTKQRELIASHFLLHHPSPDDHRTAQRMVDVLKTYNSRYAHDGWPKNVVDGMVEVGFRLPMCMVPVNKVIPYNYGQLVIQEGNPVVDNDASKAHKFFIRNLNIYWTGRIDLVLSQPPLLWVVDHKTTSSGGNEFVEAFRLATQTLGYCWAAQQLLKKPVAGCIINSVLIRPPLKSGKGTLPREEFDRLPFFYRQDQIDEWFVNTSQTVADFASCLVRGFFPMSGPKSFKSPCTYCDYHDNCQKPLVQRPADLSSRLYRDVTWNPLSE